MCIILEGSNAPFNEALRPTPQTKDRFSRLKLGHEDVFLPNMPQRQLVCAKSIAPRVGLLRGKTVFQIGREAQFSVREEQANVPPYKPPVTRIVAFRDHARLAPSIVGSHRLPCFVHDLSFSDAPFLLCLCADRGRDKPAQQHGEEQGCDDEKSFSEDKQDTEDRMLGHGDPPNRHETQDAHGDEDHPKQDHRQDIQGFGKAVVLLFLGGQRYVPDDRPSLLGRKGKGKVAYGS